MWTTKDDEFCLENGISGAARLLWQWIKRQAAEGDEQEPDLQDFNKWVAAHRGKPFHRDTLKRAIAQLADLRVIRIVRAFTWRIYRLVCRPLSWLMPRKNSRSRAAARDSVPSNPQSTDAEVQQQQHLLEENIFSPATLPEIVELCRDAGITFRLKEFDKLITYSAEDIRRAIHHFHVRGGHAKIGNPSGWMLDCLKDKWWIDQQVYADYHLGGLFSWIYDSTIQP